MIKSVKNAEHYWWGEKCEGWHLVKSQELSIIQELMPPGTAEQKHFHQTAFQFFYILKGTATFELENEIIEVSENEGINIKPGIKHQIKNQTESDLEFIVISQPTTRGDRIDIHN